MEYPIKTLSQLRPILKGFRKQAGFTQGAVAQRLGISQQSYAAFEANPEVASVDRLFRVLRQFGVTITLGASDQSESQIDSPSGSTIPSPSSPARKRTRSGGKEAGTTSSPPKPNTSRTRPPAGKISSTARKQRSQPAASDDAHREPRPASKTRENW